MRFFNYFDISELFFNLSDSERKEFVDFHFIDNSLVLLSVLDALREYLSCPIVITSTYRDELHNKSVGGVPLSQHLLGSAIDFKVKNIPHESAVFMIRDFFHKSAMVRFVGQLIIYDSFFHIGLRTPNYKNYVVYDKRKCKKSD